MRFVGRSGYNATATPNSVVRPSATWATALNVTLFKF
jgi:hypothetical protein